MFKIIKNNIIPSIIVALVVIGFIVGVGSALSGGGIFTSGNINKGLVGYWPLDGSGGGAEATVNLAPNPYFMDATLGANYTHVNSGWGSSTLLQIESITGPLGGSVQAFTEELISYTSEANMEGAQSEISSGGTNTLTLTAGQTYTISIYVKANANDTSSNLLYITGVSGSQSSATMNVTTEWTRISRSFTPSVTGSHALRHYFYNATTGFKIYYTGLQIELKDHITPFVDGTRLDRVADNTPNGNDGNIYGADVRNHGYSFTTGNNIDAGNIPLDAAGEMTLSFWVKPEATASGHEIAIGNADNNCNAGFSFSHYSSGAWYFYHANDTWSLWTAVPTEYQHVVLQIKKGDYKKAYRNGVLYNTNSSIGTQSLDSGNFIIGNGGGLLSANAFHGNISDVRLYNSILTAAEILDLYNGADIGSPIGQWNLDTGTKDSSGNGNHGTTTGASLIGKAAYFDGSDDSIDTTFDGTDEDLLSFSFWAKANDITTVGAKNIVDNSLGANGYIIRIDTGNMMAYNYYSSSGLKSRSMAVPDTDWHFWVARFTDTSVSLSLDGGTFSSTTFSSDTFTVSADTMTIGSDIAGGDVFPGYISDLRVYNRAITQSDVESLYNKGREGRSVTQISTKSKGLVGHWELNEESEKVGDNVITSWSNSDFDTFTSSGSNITSMVSGANGDNNYATFTYTVGKTYRMTFTSARAQGNIYITLGNDTGLSSGAGRQNIQTSGVDSGINVIDFVPNAAYPYSGFFATGVWADLVITDFSVKEIRVGDSTPNGNHGTVYGATSTTDRKGQANGAMSFDGSNDKITLDTSVGSMGAGDWAIGFWWKSNGAQGNYTSVIEQGFTGSPSSGAWAFKVRHTSGNINFSYYNGGIVDNLSGTNPNDDIWHYILASRSGTNLSVYMDASLIDTITLPSGYSFGTGAITNIGYNSRDSAYLKGSLSDFRIYDRALSLSEIQSLYDSYKSKVTAGSLYKGLVGSWSLKSKDEKTGSMLWDANASTFESGTYSWSIWGSSTINNVGNALTITYGADQLGAYDYFMDARDLNTDLIVGKSYRLTFDAKTTGGSNTAYGDIEVNPNPHVQTGILTNTMTKYHLDFTATSATSNYFSLRGLSAGNIITVDNIFLKEMQVADKTPYANHGDIYNAVVGSGGTTFDGVDDTRIVTSGTPLEENEATVSLWFKPNATTGSQRIIRSLGANTNRYYMILSPTSSISFVRGNNVSRVVSQSFSVGTWYHVVWYWKNDGYIQKVYIDSVEEYNGTYSGVTSGGDAALQLGTSTDTEPNFNGELSNVRVYNRMLSDGEVVSLYNQGR